MGLTLPLALLLTLGVAIVVIAHSLRKGRAAPLLFPAARLIVENTASARKQQRIEDRALLTLRSLLVIALALLSASPFVSCSRLTLARDRGASISAAIVIDDSASMRASQDGKSRLERAIEAARQLLSDAQPGDSFSVVLAGAPSRVLVPATTDLESAKEALAMVKASDRGTDIAGALTLARGLQSQAPQRSQPVVLLSDLSVTETLDLSGVSVPPIGITKPLSNCALVKATMTQSAILAEVTCTDAEAIKDRTLSLEGPKGSQLGKTVAAHDGVVSIPLLTPTEAEKTSDELKVMLSPSKADQIVEDDRCTLLRTSSQLTFAVRADEAKASVKTGSDTVLQSGLEALERGVRAQPLSLLPDDAAELSDFAGLLIDDPSGFSPEVRKAIETWVKKGGVAAVFLGPSISRSPLGANFTPFLETAPTWVNDAPPGTSEEEPGALGPLTTTWNDLNARGHAQIGSAPALQTLAAWTDGSKLVASRELGQGLLIVSGLPSSVDLSDFAIRPAYLELLDYIVGQANVRLGASATPVGQKWRIPPGAQVTDQSGQVLETTAASLDTRMGGANDVQPSRRRTFDPTTAGLYFITADGQQTRRYATRIPEEHVTQPRTDLSNAQTQETTSTKSKVGISREVALFVLLLSVLELALRVVRREKSALLGSNLQSTRSSTKVPAS